jgi:signal peptidase I
VAGPACRVLGLSAALTTLVATFGVWWLRRGWAVITVEGPSMEPTFHHGDRVVVRRTPPFAVASGDVVVVDKADVDPTRRYPQGRILDGRQWMIKRVGAVAGDPVPDGIPVPDAVVPAGKLVLLGDNARNSVDSRMVGYFPAERLLGGVVRRMR